MSFRMMLSMIALAALGLTGCGTTVTADRWRTEVERYVDEQADGDPSGLRCVVNADGEPEFTVLGGNAPTDGVDACGRLVDVVEVDGRTWLVYALAQLKNQQVEQIRPAAVTRGSNGLRCVIGKADPKTVRHYLDASSKHAPALADLEPIHTWPRPGDRFVASAEGSMLTLSDLRSGARWRLQLPPTQ
jgi:hypothetical protein